MYLTKHHGLGNDFLIHLGPPPADAAELARRLCARHTGVGADGLVFAPSRPDGSVDLHLFNADGSRAEVSGNGIRCVVQAVSRKRGVADLDLAIHTDAGLRRARLLGAGDAPATVIVRADMGPVVLGSPVAPSDEISELVEGRRWATGDIGNPHLVVLVDGPALDLASVGPRLEACFSAGVNVHAVEPRSADRIYVRTWERGAHLTEACGSGACVSTAVLSDWGLLGERAEVEMPGGSASVELGERVELTGPSTQVATIEVDDG